MICLFFFMTYRLPDKVMKPAYFISKNITRIYIVHYVIIESIIILSQKKFKDSMTAGSCYALAALFIVISLIVVWIYDKKLAKTARAFFGRHIYFWYGVIIVTSLILCVWAYTGGAEFPNLYNNYLGL
jgi:surface polysaccharide O-acyltransferase-like enzyme